MRVVFFVLFCWVWGLPAFAMVPCEDGYFANDANECEICPAGYFCYDGYKNTCPGMHVTDFEKIGAIALEGVAEIMECGFSYVPPGYYLYCSGGPDISVRECEPGDYCPGIDYVVRAQDLRNTGFGGSRGNVSCGLAYSAAGSDSADDCVLCPEYADKDYHYAGLVFGDADDSAETCAIDLMFGPQDVISVYQLLLSELLGVTLELSPSYRPWHLNNVRGGYLLSLKWDVNTNEYVVDLEGVQLLACGAGYFAPAASEQWPPNFEPPESLEELTVEAAINFLCAPVGKGAYSPGYEVDMDNAGFAWYPCPDGTYSAGYGIGADEEADCCVSGYRSYDGACAQMCMAGISHLKTSTGISAPLFAQPITVPALHVKYNDTVCHLPLEAGERKGTLNINYNGRVYHIAE